LTVRRVARCRYGQRDAPRRQCLGPGSAGRRGGPEDWPPGRLRLASAIAGAPIARSDREHAQKPLTRRAREGVCESDRGYFWLLSPAPFVGFFDELLVFESVELRGGRLDLVAVCCPSFHSGICFNSATVVPSLKAPLSASHENCSSGIA